jgi:hypothetical protein
MPDLCTFDYAIVRVVPRVEREDSSTPVCCFSARAPLFSGALELDPQRFRHCALFAAIGLTSIEHGATRMRGRADPAHRNWNNVARFHWLVAPRSTIIQTRRALRSLPIRNLLRNSCSIKCSPTISDT